MSNDLTAPFPLAKDSRAGSRRDTLRCSVYKVQLSYFRQTGKFLAVAETTITRETIQEVWAAVNDMRRLGRLPGLRPGTGRDLFVVIDVPDHPQRELHMVMPPFLDEDDVTPSRAMTGEAALLVRVPLEEVPRTTTRDVVNPSTDTQGANRLVTSSRSSSRNAR